MNTMLHGLRWTARIPACWALTTLLCLSVNLVQATEWHTIGPDTLKVNDYVATDFDGYRDVLLTDNGLWFGTLEGEWTHIEDNVGLPATSAIYLFNDSLLVCFGDGSWSDGVYLYVHGQEGFTLLEWMLRPAFVHWNEVGFYVGYEYGLKFSADLETWSDVPYFENGNVTAMSSLGSQFIVSVSGTGAGAYYSMDAGWMWDGPSDPDLPFNAFLQAYNGPTFGSFGDETDSSGLYASVDHGATWEVVFYSTGLIDLAQAHQYVICAWDGMTPEGEGVVAYDPETSLRLPMNEGLPCQRVNRLSFNGMVTTINVVACTDSGAYYTYDFPFVHAETESVQPNQHQLDCHPNPFNSSATVTLDLPDAGYYRLALFDLLGREVTAIHQGWVGRGDHRWTVDGSHLGSGMYLLALKGTQSQTVRKLVLLR